MGRGKPKILNVFVPVNFVNTAYKNKVTEDSKSHVFVCIFILELTEAEICTNHLRGGDGK